MLPQIAGLNLMKILQNGGFNHKTNSWLLQVAGLYFSSPFCKFPTHFSTANWGILNEFNINIKTESDIKINSSSVIRGKTKRCFPRLQDSTLRKSSLISLIRRVPKLQDFNLNSPFCTFPTNFPTANLGILEVDVV